MHRAAFILPLMTLVSACGTNDLSLAISGLPGEASTQPSEQIFKAVSSEIWCESGEAYSVCVLEVHADNAAHEGLARSVSLNLPTEQGELDLATVPVGYEPLVFAFTDDVSGAHPTFSWACTYASGSIELASAPRPGEACEGSMDVVLSCQDTLGGSSAEGVTAVGDFVVTPTGADPSL